MLTLGSRMSCFGQYDAGLGSALGAVDLMARYQVPVARELV